MATVSNYCALFTVVVLLSGCSYERTIRYQLEAPVQSMVLEATGYAVVASQPGSSYEDKLLQAMAASRQDAYRRLAEQLYGKKLSASSSADQTVLTADKVQSQVQGVIKGAELVTEAIEGNFYVTRLKLDTANLLTLPQAELTPVSSRLKWWY
ncbi:LPP20 family lipoprotein [Rheinheimera sp.]|uniref:LPP20 family lipoprotein n=1 Tax=Rheinheimera sp. TaxID=1869214 RepID=UPI0027349478|nr:flagellar biosynthesis protein FlgP [Rheinheimera sp.]MDP2717072.1 flagellar biosynthesis protein FlgP [Rheinheimera sp.]